MMHALLYTAFYELTDRVVVNNLWRKKTAPARGALCNAVADVPDRIEDRKHGTDT